MKVSTQGRHYLILLIAFAAAVLVRLPNLNRPLSKHHEFNTAVILNGIISWKEAGGAARFGYTPLMTYKGNTNRLLQRGPYTDAQGNQVYLSLGAGWYVLPYFVFSMLHLPFTPLSLQWLNLFIHLLTIFALYQLGKVLVKHYTLLSPQFPLFACLVFLFTPGPLWYFGNGYVHAAIAVPFAIALFTLYLKLVFGHAQLQAGNATAFVLLGLVGIYLDWFMVFLLAVLGAYALFLFVQKRKRYWLHIFLLSGATALVSVVLVFYQFVHFLGLHQVVDYWTSRAADRSFTMGEVSWWQRMVSVITNLLTCTGFSLLFFIAGLVVLFLSKKKTILFPCLLWLIACICYNGIFFNWSSEHEFSLVPVSVVISLVAAYFTLQLLSAQAASIALSLLCTINVVQYYFINPPGSISRSGTPYNQHQILGEEIGRRIPASYRIFSNLNNDPMVEYYAHRSFVQNRAATAAIARQISDSLQVPKAVWLQIDSLQIKKLQWIR